MTDEQGELRPTKKTSEKETTEVASFATRELILSAIGAAWLPQERKKSLVADFERSPAWEPQHG